MPHLRARYYHPDTEQFLSRDPLVATTHRPYAYAGGNPLNGGDPSGLCDQYEQEDCPRGEPPGGYGGDGGAVPLGTGEGGEPPAGLAGNAPQYYFRGTSEGFSGSPALQRLGITPVSTDPLVASVFGTEVETVHGSGVVYIATAEDLAGITISEGNVLRGLEKEFAVEVPPLEFAGRASMNLEASQARFILTEMNLPIPGRISGIDRISIILNETPRLTPEQINEFVYRAQEMLRR